MFDLVKQFYESIEKNYVNNQKKYFYLLNKLYQKGCLAIYQYLEISVEIKAKLVDWLFNFVCQQNRNHLQLLNALPKPKPKKEVILTNNTCPTRCDNCKTRDNMYVFVNKKWLCFQCCIRLKVKFKVVNGYWNKLIDEFTKIYELPKDKRSKTHEKAE